jgi:pyruvate/2-oxoglutarate/acetoin dehydrogenase E1 component
MREITYRQAMTEALFEEMERDGKVILWGEDVAQDCWGINTGLAEKFGNERICETAIHEDAIIGAAVGAGLGGYRVIADIMFADFLLCAGDEFFNQVAKWRIHNGAQSNIPIVIKVAIGGYSKYGAIHSQCLEGLAMHTPGVKIALPATPADAKGLLKAAIRDNNPVVFLFHKKLLDVKGKVPQGEHIVPLGVADIKRKGSDVTVVATSFMVTKALQVADQLHEKGISVEIIDPRTLEPLDIDTIVTSVKKTRRAVIVDEDVSRCGPTAEIAMQIMERASDSLATPIRRVAAANMPVPQGFMEQYVLPQNQDIADAIGTVLGLKKQLVVN